MSTQEKQSIEPTENPGGAPPVGDPAGVRPGRWRWLVRLGLVIGLAFGFGYLPLQFFGERGLTQYRRLRSELGELQERNQRLAEGIRQLRLEIDRLRDDPVALEKAARDELGMVRPGELIFVSEQ